MRKQAIVFFHLKNPNHMRKKEEKKVGRRYKLDIEEPDLETGIQTDRQKCDRK